MNNKRFNEPLKGIPVWATARLGYPSFFQLLDPASMLMRNLL
jgi:hypothetical protein